MQSELDAQREKFEATYRNSGAEFWLQKNADGSYKNIDTQESWLLFLNGWKGNKEWVDGLAVADLSFMPTKDKDGTPA